MTDDPRVEAARHAFVGSIMRQCEEADDGQYDPDVALVEAVAAANKAAWRPISEARSQEDVLATGKVSGEWARPVLAYHEPYKDLGWMCAVTHRPLAHQPTHFYDVPAPPSDD